MKYKPFTKKHDFSQNDLVGDLSRYSKVLKNNIGVIL